jgi:hypothetical protein
MATAPKNDKDKIEKQEDKAEAKDEKKQEKAEEKAEKKEHQNQEKADTIVVNPVGAQEPYPMKEE